MKMPQIGTVGGGGSSKRIQSQNKKFKKCFIMTKGSQFGVYLDTQNLIDTFLLRIWYLFDFMLSNWYIIDTKYILDTCFEP